MKAERVVLGIQKTADGGTWADGMVSLLITCSCSLGFPELGVREKLQAEEPAAEGERGHCIGRPWGKALAAVPCFPHLYKVVYWSYTKPLCLR